MKEDQDRENASRPRLALVTACDDGFVPFLEGWLATARSADFAGDVEIAVLDAGLRRSVRDALEHLGVTLLSMPGDLDFPENTPGGLKALLTVPSLLTLLPHSDVIFWSDCDCWFQMPDVIQAYHDGSLLADGAACPEIDRSYRGVFTQVRGAPFWYRHNVKSYWHDLLEELCRRHLDADLAHHLVRVPYVNMGLLCMSRGSNIWAQWQELTWNCVDKRRSSFHTGESELADLGDYMVVQNCLNATIQLSHHTMAYLPPLYNWMCHLALPVVNPKNQLCEPNFPFNPLHVIHMTSYTKTNQVELISIDHSGMPQARRASSNLSSPSKVTLVHADSPV